MAKFVSRARVYQNEVARFRRWRSIDSDLHIIEINSLYGLPRRVLLVRRHALGESLVSRHKSKAAAEKAAAKL